MVDKKEMNYLKKKGYTIVERDETKRTDVQSLICFVSDTRRMHESGYPFIRIFGIIKHKELIDLGWHDHYVVNKPVNVDSFSKNIFHMMDWGGQGFFVEKGNLFWSSTFEICANGRLR